MASKRRGMGGRVSALFIPITEELAHDFPPISRFVNAYVGRELLLTLTAEMFEETRVPVMELLERGTDTWDSRIWDDDDDWWDE
jgi:hypothetical protein